MGTIGKMRKGRKKNKRERREKEEKGENCWEWPVSWEAQEASGSGGGAPGGHLSPLATTTIDSVRKDRDII